MGLRIGEVIRTNTGEFVAQCYDLNSPPRFGSLVKVIVEPHRVYGFVVFVTVTSIDPGRKPVAVGKDMEKLSDVYQAHPQLSRLLAVEFNAVIAGYYDGNRVNQYLPPYPPPLHSFAEACSDDEIALFSSSLNFLGTLVQAQLPVPKEEVIPAIIRNLAAVHKDKDEFLVKAGKELTRLLINETNQLNAILRRIG